MKTLALVAFGLFASGCLGLVGGGGPQGQTSNTEDMAKAPANNGGGGNGGSGGSGGSGGGVGGNGGADMAMHQGGGGSGGSGGGEADMAGGNTATNVAYGGDCNYPGVAQMQANCATGLTCEQFANGAVHKCTKACTMSGLQDPTECPAPATGKCTPNLYCQFM